MRLTNELALDTPPDRLFALLTDVRTVAGCVPGAHLEGGDGDTHRGSVTIRLGPVTAAYSGTVRFIEVDTEGRRAVLDARGVDRHGSGNAEAKVSVVVRPRDGGSLLALETDLVVRGTVARFGRGVLREVSQTMLEEFAGNLGGVLAAPAPQSSPAADTAAELNGLTVVVGPLLRRAVPVLGGLVGGLVVGFAVAWALRGRRAVTR